MMKRLSSYVVILAGGGGERLWPLSAPSRPKQFLKVLGGKTLIRQSLERVLPLVPAENVLVVTARSLGRMTRAELPEVPRANILLEPCRRNTAPAVAVALGEILRRSGPEAAVAVVTADQLVTKPRAFRTALNRAFGLARRKDAIVTLGIRPTFPSTAYGYIDAARRTFVEKPDLATAKRYVSSGRYVWNAGLFIFRAGVLRTIIDQHSPELGLLVDRVTRARSANALLPRVYPGLTSISFDYAIMEKTRAIEVVGGDFGWDDVGGYVSLAAHLPADADGNVLQGAVRQLASARCTLLGDGCRISAFGVQDLVIVSHGQDVLVAHRSCAHDLKRLLQVGFPACPDRPTP